MPRFSPTLEEVFDQAPEGAVYVISRYRCRNQNLRTQLLRILRKAGVKAWPRLFHNLRASRETELAAQYPIHVICAWIGNTVRIAAKHYLQVTDDYFARAVEEGGAKSGALKAQKAAQSPAGSDCLEATETQKAPEIRGLMQSLAAAVSRWSDDPVTPTGFEPVSRP